MDMKCITIATFISKNEYENKKIYETINYLKKYFRVDVIIFSDNEMENKNKGIKTIITPKMTKYRRIQILLNEAESNDILCIDNDIEPNRENILNFINKCLKVNYSIAWGKVKAQKTKGVISKIINIDKNLSHDYIRPTLWKMNIGISLPGQIFMINKKYFKDKLPKIDTVYDDLMIGAVAREKHYPIFFVKEILGYEKPKKNIIELLQQRIRWAKGLAETIMYNRKNKVLPFILLHGFFFNLLWFPIYLIIFTLIKINLLLGLFMIALISYLLTEKDIREIIWSIMYMIVFPLVYVVWGISLIYNLIKIYINNKKAKGSRLWTANLINYYKKQKNMQEKES